MWSDERGARSALLQVISSPSLPGATGRRMRQHAFGALLHLADEPGNRGALLNDPTTMTVLRAATHGGDEAPVSYQEATQKIEH